MHLMVTAGSVPLARLSLQIVVCYQVAPKPPPSADRVLTKELAGTRLRFMMIACFTSGRHCTRASSGSCDHRGRGGGDGFMTTACFTSVRSPLHQGQLRVLQNSNDRGFRIEGNARTHAWGPHHRVAPHCDPPCDPPLSTPCLEYQACTLLADGSKSRYD